MTGVPLAWLNDFLQPYDVGQALLVIFVLVLLGTLLASRSRKVLALTVGVFGLLFALAPSQAAPGHWRFLGFLLVVIAPVAYVLAEE